MRCFGVQTDTRNAGQSQMIINANPSSEMKDSSSSGPGRMKENEDERKGKKD